ncbi:MAG: hypothetical protein HKP61_11875 [Dactylosporangium sp.]|nr:hypothetical protein [Dactylosporangium sp.]NNJ61622.1 hypothetical protein [Dactylosporangium sp.]
MTQTAPQDAPLVFPVGQFFGTFHTNLETVERRHNIRLGGEIRELDDQHFSVWAVLHGVPDQLERRPWSSQTVVEALLDIQRDAVAQVTAAVEAADVQPSVVEAAATATMDAADAARIITELIADGLAAEFVPEGAAALEFARTHRIGARMLGLGNTAEEPWHYSIGFFDQPIITVTRMVYNLWEWAATADTLWSACDSLAEQEREAGGDEPDLTDPVRLLGGFLRTIHHLLSVSVVYLEPRR